MDKRDVVDMSHILFPPPVLNWFGSPIARELKVRDEKNFHRNRFSPRSERPKAPMFSAFLWPSRKAQGTPAQSTFVGGHPRQSH